MHRCAAGVHRIRLNLPESGYNDFDSKELPKAAGLKGKIVVVVNGGPAELPGPFKSYARTAPMIRAIRAAGAVGTDFDSYAQVDGLRLAAHCIQCSQPGMRLAAMDGDEAVAIVIPHWPTITANYLPPRSIPHKPRNSLKVAVTHLRNLGARGCAEGAPSF